MKPGDRVECVLTDGSRTEFVVTGVEPDAVLDGTRRIPAADIARLDVKRNDASKTLVTTVGVLVGIGLIAVAVQAASRPLQVDVFGKK